jgi:hypothetical protein
MVGRLEPPAAAAGSARERTFLVSEEIILD